MRDWGCKLDMSQPFAPNLRLDDLHPALVADDAPVLHPFVLAAYAFPVLYRTEYLRAKKSVPFRLECPVVDRLGLFHLAVRPFAYPFRRGELDPYRLEVSRILRFLENGVNVFCHSIPPSSFSPEALHQVRDSGVLLLIHGRTRERLVPASRRP